MYSVTKEQVLSTIPGSDRVPRCIDLSGFPRSFLDVPYSHRSPALRLDLVLPNQGEGPFPTIVFIHGGGWLTGDKSHIQTQSVYRLLYAGYAVCCLNYRLSDEAKWPLPLHDCKAAIRFLRANARRFCLDTERIGVVGNSAGGHLAAMLGTTNGQPEYEDLTMGCPDASSDVQAVFVWFGIYDFLNWESDWNAAYPDRPFPETVSAEAYLFGHPLRAFPQRLAHASPICQLNAQTVPFYVEHGTADHAVPYIQCVRFYERYVQLLGKETISIRLFDSAEHSDPVFRQDENVFEFVRFFDRHIRQIPPRDFFPLGRLGDQDGVV